MSTKAKGSTVENSTDRIIVILDKNDVDEAIQIYRKVKEYIGKRVSEKSAELNNKQNEYELLIEKL